jgi:tRNA dimethylallyltransferase
MAREVLYQRLEARISAMLAAGFMNELHRLREMQLPPDATAMQSLGYKQMLPGLDDVEQYTPCVELWKRDTRRYAKRQMTWFRHQLPTQWIGVDGLATSQVAELIMARYSVS